MKQILLLVVVIIIANMLQATTQENVMDRSNWYKVNRGDLSFYTDYLELKDCIVVYDNELENDFDITFEVSSYDNEAQMWFGFGYKDRRNRYAIGLRGGNCQDIYFCEYKEMGKDKLINLLPQDNYLSNKRKYKVRLIRIAKQFQLIVDGESKFIKEIEEDLTDSKFYFGGGWTLNRFSSLAFNKPTGFIPSPVVVNEPSMTSKREEERKNYKPRIIRFNEEVRRIVDLSGQWLFLPDYEVTKDPSSRAVADDSWHVMNVPDFWNPARNWLHLQDSNLAHPGSGVSDNYWQKEIERCENYTFDYKDIDYGWYRNWIELPGYFYEKRYKLNFEGISKVADLYINGTYVDSHIGMFGNWNIDVTDFLIPGKNLIALKVKVRHTDKGSGADDIVGRAVSVDITNDMLNSLPHGMFAGTEGGIWQPVQLQIVSPAHIEDVFANFNSTGGTLETTITSDDRIENVSIVAKIVDNITNEVIWGNYVSGLYLDAGETSTVNIPVNDIEAKLWSPESPNLYRVIVDLETHYVHDSYEFTTGFRSFSKDGSKFMLNNEPYWIKGANHPPCGIAPNDKHLADIFLKNMHDNNQLFTRSHGCPFTKTWLKSADEQGVGVSYEGTWPWLMIGDMPSDELLDIWYDEMLNLVKKYRNHPSILIWTINNEMYFTMFNHNKPKEERIEKWTILSNLIKDIRRIAPNRLICADSGYSRVAEDYKKNLQPNDIDDGDIDDRHIYPGWYNRDFYQFKDGEWAQRKYWSPGSNSDRPFLSQETSTGYPNNDTGHSTRKYLFKHYVPQALVGNYAWEDVNPKYFLKRHAFLTKELAEQIRRSSPETSGLMLFSNVCWYKNAFNPTTIEAYPVVEGVKKAYNDVLISLEMFGRHYYSGDSITERLYIINDKKNFEKLDNLVLKTSLIYNGKAVNITKNLLNDVAANSRSWEEYNFSISGCCLPVNKGEYQLELELSDYAGVIATNSYDITITKSKEVKYKKDKIIALYDPTNKILAAFEKLHIKAVVLEDLTQMRMVDYDLLVIANIDADDEVPYNWEDVNNIVRNGSNVLLIHPGKHLKWLLPKHIDKVYERRGRMASMLVPEHQVFDDIKPLELSFWQSHERETPFVCKRSFTLKKEDESTKLAYYLRPHIYLAHPEEELLEMSGYPLIEFELGKGKLIASELMLNHADKDSVAGLILLNSINYLLKY
jgi:hypothetical protein